MLDWHPLQRIRGIPEGSMLPNQNLSTNSKFCAIVIGLVKDYLVNFGLVEFDSS